MFLRKRIARRTAALVALATLISANVAQATSLGLPKKLSKQYKNVIVLVPDGCDATVQTAARLYKGDKLAVDYLDRSAVTTSMANSIITGSAAAATAFASGFKTTARFLGIGPREDDVLSTYEFPYDPAVMSYRPLATVLEGARAEDKATGLVSTSRVTHATPAAFASHIQDRGWDNDIMEHMVYQDIDVVFGGGKRHLLPKAEGGKRTDNENLLDVLQTRGYQWVETRDQMMDLYTGRAWGLFNMSHMHADIDRAEFAPEEPSIAEMTEKAIELLSQDKDGFFLMVEGSQVDWAGHNNDPIYMITDFLAFDEAVRVAVEYAMKDGETAVLVYPDHNTGGMKIGHYGSDARAHYTATTYEAVVDPLKGMKISSGGVAKKISDPSDPACIKMAVKEWWGLDITDEDVDAIMNWPHSSSLNYRLAAVLSKNYTVFGWTTHGHNAEDVPVWTYGTKLEALVDNTDLAKTVFDAFRIDHYELNDELFVDVDKAFAGYWSLNESDAANPVLEICSDAGCAELPVSKDILTIKVNGRNPITYNLDGIVVHAPATDRVYIPQEAVDLINHYAAIY